MHSVRLPIVIIVLLVIAVAAGTECRPSVMPEPIDCGVLAGANDEMLVLVPDSDDPCLCRLDGDPGVLPTFDQALNDAEILAFAWPSPCHTSSQNLQVGICGDGEYLVIRQGGETTTTRYYDPETRMLVGETVNGEFRDTLCLDTIYHLERIACDDYVMTRNLCDEAIVPDVSIYVWPPFGMCEFVLSSGASEMTFVRDVVNPCICVAQGDTSSIPTFDEQLASLRSYYAEYPEICTDFFDIGTEVAGRCNGGEVLHISSIGPYITYRWFYDPQTRRLIAATRITRPFDELCHSPIYVFDQTEILDCVSEEGFCF